MTSIALESLSEAAREQVLKTLEEPVLVTGEGVEGARHGLGAEYSGAEYSGAEYSDTDTRIGKASDDEDCARESE